MCGGPLKCGGPCSAEHVRTLVNPALDGSPRIRQQTVNLKWRRVLSWKNSGIL